MIPGIPEQQLGYVLPVGVADGVHHAFYSVCGLEVNMVGYPGVLAAFSRADGERALESAWPAMEFLAERRVDRIVIGGLPVTTSAPPAFVHELCAQATEHFGIPVISDAEDTVMAVRALGARRVALATKWSPDVVAGVREHLVDGGIEVVRDFALPHTAQQVVALQPEEGFRIALELADGALGTGDPVDCLVLGGGAWFVLPAIEQVEQRYGVPVVSNIAASLWGFLDQIGRSPVTPGWGVLLDRLLVSSTDA
ncbi:aspartate/glutamate racemase family protein [Leifsonia sp. Root112D2]|uniref:aspartate racemase/maleate isomerase family protein n=1 Tax=Leifsonia sp. Root112D2 TaxID=1736426 RepID=UPI0006F6BE8E|nr:aspartate/glutamate racemase family protein [Leifsonia sp. Root112D2]KQV06448.1 hypothetical protein ASC63_03110 [Leifsonia sp. Root112D2]